MEYGETYLCKIMRKYNVWNFQMLSQEFETGRDNKYGGEKSVKFGKIL